MISDEELKEHSANKCRNCRHFKRVNFHGIDNVMNRQGFCILGELEGDYSLYMSSSNSRECMAYIFDDAHFKITKAEKQLSEDVDKFTNSLNDGRTTNHGQYEPVMSAHMGYFENVVGKGAGSSWMAAHMERRRFGYEQFKKDNSKRFFEVRDMVILNKSDYLKFLAKFSVEIHNQFCDCDTIGLDGDANAPRN